MTKIKTKTYLSRHESPWNYSVDKNMIKKDSQGPKGVIKTNYS